nr:unnamed protein product [Naegleria fowleri]
MNEEHLHSSAEHESSSHHHHQPHGSTTATTNSSQQHPPSNLEEGLTFNHESASSGRKRKKSFSIRDSASSSSLSYVFNDTSDASSSMRGFESITLEPIPLQTTITATTTTTTTRSSQYASDIHHPEASSTKAITLDSSHHQRYHHERSVSPNSTSTSCHTLFKHCCGKIIEVVGGVAGGHIRTSTTSTQHQHLPSVEHFHHDSSHDAIVEHPSSLDPVLHHHEEHIRSNLESITLPPIHHRHNPHQNNQKPPHNFHNSHNSHHDQKVPPASTEPCCAECSCGDHSSTKHNSNKSNNEKSNHIPHHPHYEHHTSFPTPQFYKRSPTVALMKHRCNSEPLKRSLEKIVGGDSATRKHLHISQIENYIPNITNNYAQYVSVTIKIDSFVKGFEISHENIQNDDISPIVDKSMNQQVPHRRKSHCTSVVVGSNLSHSFKYFDTIYVHMILPPNSKTNIRPNSIEDDCSEENVIPKCTDSNRDQQSDSMPTPRNITDSCDSISKPRRKSCLPGHAKVQPVKKHYTYQIVDFKVVKPNEFKHLDQLNGEDEINHDHQFHDQSEGEDDEESVDNEDIIHIPGGVFCKSFIESSQKSSSRPDTASSSIHTTRRPPFSTFSEYHYVPPKIHQILLTRKQRRNIKDMIDIINNTYQEDVESTGISQCSLPVNFVDRLNYLMECPDSFVLVRDEAFCDSLSVNDVMGLSMFGYAAKHKQYYIINELCRKQPYRVLQDIVQDIDQLEFIASLEDKRVMGYIIHSLLQFVEKEKEILAEHLNGSLLHNNLDEGHLDFRRFGSVEQLESFFKNMLVRYFTFIDSVFCVEAWTQTVSDAKPPFLSQSLFIQEAIKTSKPKVLKYLIAEGLLKCNDYCEGGTALHWACLNRSMETIQMLLKVKTLNKGLKVRHKLPSNSRLKPFEKKTAYEIGKDLFQSVPARKDECAEMLRHLNPTTSDKLQYLVGKIFSK